MRINIKIIWIFTLFISFMFSSCNEDNGTEELFGESVNERLDEQKSELKDLLTSSEQGWKMLYFTNDQEFGGFTFLMKFKEDNTVEMTSDVNDDTAVLSGKYTIELGSTVKLNFTTYNHIHKVTDAYEPSGLRGKGYEGSAEFLYYGNENGEINFRSVKGVGEERITFQKATEEDWNNLIAENLENQSRLSGTPYDPVYRGLKLTVNGEETIYPFSYDALKRYVDISGLTSEGKIVDRSYGVGFVGNGFIASPELNIGDRSFSYFEWNGELNKYQSVNDNAEAELLFLDTPVLISDDYLLVNNNAGGGHRMFSFTIEYPYLIDTPYTSAHFLELFYEARQNYINTQNGREFYRFYIEFTEGTNEGRVRYRYYSGSSSFYLYHKFTYAIVDKKVVLSDDGWESTNYSDSREEALAPVDQLLFNPEGFYVELVQEKYNFSNPVYTFTSAADTSIRFPSWSYN